MRAVLPRRWRPRDAGERVSPVSTGHAVAGRCSVLLGPPGAGKTTALHTAPGSRVVSLGREFGLAATLEAALADDSTRLLALDGLDESPLTTTGLAGLVEDVVDRLRGPARLVLACRSAAWLPGVEQVLRHAYPELVIFDLEPLTTDDIARYAASAGLDPDAFLTALHEANARPLAATPITLGFLTDEYAAGATLPGTQQELYARSCARLLSEPNTRRLDPRHPVDLPDRLDRAGRLAVFSLFTARTTFALSHEPTAGALTLADGEPGDAEVLATALFDSAGPGLVRFHHQSAAEYLAARHLAGSTLTGAQLDGLLRGRGGYLAPPVQAVAAWLIARAPDRFAGLLDDDPLAFLRSSVELTDPAYRRSLVGRLLELAGRHELPDLSSLPLQRLGYPGIEEQLGDVLTDPSGGAEARLLAIRMARKNELTGLTEVLADVALDDRRPVEVRAAAGNAVLELPPSSSRAALTVLAGAPHDDGDELPGVGLRALQLGGASLPELLHLLTAPHDPDRAGTYLTFVLWELPQLVAAPGLPASELCRALAWTTELEIAAGHDPGSAALLEYAEELHDAILVAGLSRADDAVVAATRRLIIVRLDQHDRLLRDESRVPEECRPTVRAALRERPELLARFDRRPRPEPEAVAGADPPDPGTVASGLDPRSPLAFPAFCAAAAGGHRSAMPDITWLPSWAPLSEEQRGRVAASAYSYLRAGAAGEPADLTGTRALVLLASRGTAVVLEPHRWAVWAPGLVRSSVVSDLDTVVTGPLRWAYEQAWAVLGAAATAEIRRRPESGRYVLRKLAPVLDPRAIPWLTGLIDREDAAGAAFALFASIDAEAALTYLRGHNGPAAAIESAIRTAGDRAWVIVRARLTADQALAAEVIGGLAGDFGYDGSALSEQHVAELWERVQDLFPRAGDPIRERVHAPDLRESIAYLRNRLLRVLAERGTAGAVRLLRELAGRHPGETDLPRLAARARAVLAQADWTPLRPAELRELLSSRKQLLRTDGDLLEIVLAALGRIQQRIQGPNPTATLLWNHAPKCGPDCRPKTEDEVSDYLAGLLADRLPGAVVNREVQVTRARTSGIGQRADLLVEAPAPADSDRILRVVIEVKGSWNREIPGALDTQLVDRYVRKWPGAAGLFLVARFGPLRSADLDGRAARAAARSGHPVRAFVLDCTMPH